MRAEWPLEELSGLLEFGDAAEEKLKPCCCCVGGEGWDWLK